MLRLGYISFEISTTDLFSSAKLWASSGCRHINIHIVYHMVSFEQ